MKIGDSVYVHGYVDEIRKDTVIIRNEGGYFGTVKSEIVEAQAIPIDWIEEWCLSQNLEYVRIAIKKMMDNWMAERKEE